MTVGLCSEPFYLSTLSQKWWSVVMANPNLALPCWVSLVHCLKIDISKKQARMMSKQRSLPQERCRYQGSCPQGNLWLFFLEEWSSLVRVVSEHWPQISLLHDSPGEGVSGFPPYLLKWICSL